MEKTNQLVIATYNIQFSSHPEEIKRNIVKMVLLGVSIFCLQEVVQNSDQAFIINELIKQLGSDWSAFCNLGRERSKLGMGNCILWNTKNLTLVREQNVFLPKYDALAIHEKIFSWIVGGITVSFQRRAVIGIFKYNDIQIRVTNLHLDQNGGLENRKRQLTYLSKTFLKDNSVRREVICGDFNSLDLLLKGKELEMQKEILGEDFLDVSNDIGWTADLNSIDLDRGDTIFKFFVKKFHIHLRRKLDYVWIKNVTSSKCERLMLNGSDHRPVIAYLKV